MMIYNYCPGPEGGSERQCRKLSIALGRRGVAPTVLTTRASRGITWSETDQAVRIVRMPTLDMLYRKPSAGARDARRVKPLLPEGRAAGITAGMTAWCNALLFQASAAIYLILHRRSFDLLHVHTAEWIAGFAVWMGNLLRKPVLCKVATLPVLPSINRNIPLRAVWDRLRRHAEFVALNEAMAKELRESGVPDERIHVIPNGVDLPRIAERNEDSRLVLFVGNLTQSIWKAFDVLFDAWGQVHRVMPSARLAVLGSGDCSPWERHLEERGCRDSVSFEGFVCNVDTFYRRAALLALPSRQEGMSNVLLESQSWGIPAVVSDIAGNQSVVHNGINGFLVPVNDTDALASGIIRLLQDPALRVVMGREARRMVERLHAIDSVADQTRRIYEILTRPSIGAK